MKILGELALFRLGSNKGKVLVKLAFCTGVVFLSSCSFEKELPIPCISEDKKAAAMLCREYLKRDLDEENKNEVLRTYGFNKRDSQAIATRIKEKSASCKATVVKQCDLIMLRNGVGY